MKMYNGGERIIVNELAGYLPTMILYFLINLRPGNRTIYLCHHAEAELPNARCSDKGLSEGGLLFGRHLVEAMKIISEGREFKVWVGEKLRPIETAKFFNEMIVTRKLQLDGSNPGVIDGLSEQEIQKRYPEEYENHQKDPYRHRYPRAEVL
jgi:6-phosphofructo-2-kinase / fructose-2,6-biphosphatase 4